MIISNDLKIIEEMKKECSFYITLTQKAAKRFFKTSEGSYAASDKFLGITVPDLRKIVKVYQDVELQIIEVLLKSQYNEERLLALLILVHQYQKGDVNRQKEIYQFYISNIDRINNWNLVDSSAYPILGHHLWDKDRSKLIELAKSEIIWERRIAIVATWYFIRNSDFEWTFKIAKFLRNDQHNLIQKALGWMLREVGKKDECQLISFLSDCSKQIHKTTFRYATERLSKTQKMFILAESA